MGWQYFTMALDCSCFFHVFAFLHTYPLKNFHTCSWSFILWWIFDPRTLTYYKQTWTVNILFISWFSTSNSIISVTYFDELQLLCTVLPQYYAKPLSHSEPQFLIFYPSHAIFRKKRSHYSMDLSKWIGTYFDECAILAYWMSTICGGATILH